MALTNKLKDIADAIREKAQTTDLLTLGQMPSAIRSIETGGGGDLPPEAYAISGDCQYRFANNTFNWYLENYGNDVITNSITILKYAFYKSTELRNVPLELNCTSGTSGAESAAFMFAECNNLENIAKMSGWIDGSLEKAFYNCYRLRDLNTTLDKLIPSETVKTDSMFENCYSLRNISRTFLYNLKYRTDGLSGYSRMFALCYALDEVKNLAVANVILNSNKMDNMFLACYRLSNFTFAKNRDGTPVTAQWKSQILDLSGALGYVPSSLESRVTTDYNSGITQDKRVYEWRTDDGVVHSNYYELKDDPDWYSISPMASRYNHASAVETINSLPNTKAYGTNTIKFRQEMGDLSGGAIHDLTTEEIAVATAKGWTVTLV